MNSKEALETLGNVDVAVTTIKSGVTHFKTLKEQYAKEFEVLEKELLFVRDIKPFDVFEEQYKKLKKALDILKEKLELPLENDFDVVNKDDIHLYRLRTKALVNEEEWKLLKEALNDEK